MIKICKWSLLYRKLVRGCGKESTGEKTSGSLGRSYFLDFLKTFIQNGRIFLNLVIEFEKLVLTSQESLNVLNTNTMR